MASLQQLSVRTRHPLDCHPRRIAHLAQLLRDVANPDANNSVVAREQLQSLAPTSGELIALLSDRSPFVRSGAAYWLRSLTGEIPATVTQALRIAIRDVNNHVIQSAIGSVGILRLSALRDDVRNCLGHSHPSVVHQAIFALGLIGSAEDGPHLLRFLQGRETHLEKAAVIALANLDHQPAIGPLIDRLAVLRGQPRRVRSHFELPRRYMQTLVALEARQAIPLLIHIARDEIGLRGMAVQSLIELRAEEAAPALLPLLEKLLHTTTEEKLCCALLYLMTAMNHRFAMPVVRSFLEHRLPGVRIAALRAVMRWKDSQALDTVRKMTSEDVSAFVRPAAVTALAELAQEQALPALEALASDANSLVRVAVAEALGRVGGAQPETTGMLELLSKDGTEAVASAAQAALSSRGEARVTRTNPAPVSKAIPPELTEQATSVRAFLQFWRSGLGADASELQNALQTVLTALGGSRKT